MEQAEWSDAARVMHAGARWHNDTRYVRTYTPREQERCDAANNEYPCVICPRPLGDVLRGQVHVQHAHSSSRWSLSCGRMVPQAPVKTSQSSAVCTDTYMRAPNIVWAENQVSTVTPSHTNLPMSSQCLQMRAIMFWIVKRRDAHSLPAAPWRWSIPTGPLTESSDDSKDTGNTNTFGAAMLLLLPLPAAATAPPLAAGSVRGSLSSPSSSPSKTLFSSLCSSSANGLGMRRQALDVDGGSHAASRRASVDRPLRPPAHARWVVMCTNAKGNVC